MKVIHKNDMVKPVSEVKHGQCFIMGRSILMKAYRDCDYCDYAVDLENGIIYKLDDTDEVFPIIAEVVVK